MKGYQDKRRRLLKNIAMTGLGLSAMPSSVLSMKTWAAAAADNSSLGDDYKALVCFYMFGGNDGFNMLVPRSGTEYTHYQTSRNNLALNQSDLLPINPIDYDGIELGLHPQLTGVQQLFQDGKLSFLCNVGTKVKQDTISSDLQNQQDLPLSLFSHNDQLKQWQTGRVTERYGIGWAAKIADLLSSCNMNPEISMNISLSNSPLFMKGGDTDLFSLSKNGPERLKYHHPDSGLSSFHGQRTAAIDAMYNHDYQNAFYNNFNDIFKTGISTNQNYRIALDAFENNGGLNTTFSTLPFSKDLEMVAKSIAIGESLGFKRQIFFVYVSGFDQHGDLLNEHEDSMNEVSIGLSEFNAALESIGKANQVVTFSMSDFGRTLTSNASGGSDHAWGSNAIVMGGPVVGQSLFGMYPSLELGSDLVYGSRGIVIPGLSTDLYFAELAHWFGVSLSHLENEIFPNLSRFYNGTAEDFEGFLSI